MLSSVEEIVLLQLAGRDRPKEFSEASNVVLAGAVMMDLASQKRIDCDLNRLFVDDPQSTGDENPRSCFIRSRGDRPDFQDQSRDRTS